MFRHYYPERFPTLWQRFDAMAEAADEIGDQGDGIRQGTGGVRQEEVKGGTLLVSESAVATRSSHTIHSSTTKGGGVMTDVEDSRTETRGALDERGAEVSSYSEVVTKVK